MHTSHQTTNFPLTTKLVPTQIYINKNFEHFFFFEELVPSGLPLFKKKKKKHIRLGQAGIVDYSVDLSIPEEKKKKRNGQKQ